MSPLVSALVAVIRVYQRALSPLTGGHCRFIPSCSHYAIEALRKQGIVVGSLLTLKRLARCHPFGGRGYDPVPAPRKEADGLRRVADPRTFPAGLSRN